MLDIYSWPTPNGHKIHIMVEECKLEYRVHPIDIGRGDQFQSDFLAISPNNKIPAMVDQNGPEGRPLALFESGAILIYLASKAGKFLGESATEKYQTLQWLMFQVAGFGPMLGQAHHFRGYAPEKIDYAIQRYTNEAKRLYGVLEKQLARSKYLAGKNYTIADIATFPWVRSAAKQGIDLNDFPHVTRWFNVIETRPAVKRGLKILAELHRSLQDQKARQVLFGAQPTN